MCGFAKPEPALIKAAGVRFPHPLPLKRMTAKVEAFLCKAGWTVECESPLEIRNQDDGTFASGQAAQIVIDYIISEG